MEPDGVETDASLIVVGEMRYQRQVRDLIGRPAELKHDHKRYEVDEASVIRRVRADEAGGEHERERGQYA